MSRSLEEFVVSHGGYTFPVEDVLTGRGFITGKSGSGKSNTASVIMEELLERDLGLLIVDTDGEYHGLKEDYDVLHVGKGPESDVGVSEEKAKKIAHDALENRLPVLLDISSYHDETVKEEVIHDVVNSLFIAEHDYRVPYVIFLEEAHEFIPQQGGTATNLESLLIRVAKRGRKRGLGICCMSQRPAAVDKDYITQCDWFVWHRLTWENDTDVVRRILGTEAGDTVQELDDGEALVMTDWDESIERIQFRRKRTPDAGATPGLDDMEIGKPRQTVAEVSERIPQDWDPEETTSGQAASADGNKREATAAEPTGGADAEVSNTSAASGSSSSRSNTDPLGDASGSSSDSRTGSGNNSSRLTGLGGAYSGKRRRQNPASFGRAKPSLERRLERRSTPSDSTDPIWEIGAMMVYLYDTFVWYQLYLLYRIEIVVGGIASRIETLLTGSAIPRRPGPYERATYRLLAFIGLGLLYAILVVGMLWFIGL